MAPRKSRRRVSKQPTARSGTARRRRQEAELSPDDLLAECKARLAMREFDGVLKITQRCHQTLSQPSRLHYYAGEAQLNTGNITAAIQRFEKAIDADPSDQLPYISLSRCYAELGNPDSARSTVERGVAACRETAELRMLSHALQPRPSISACMIVKDEEELLPGCLDSIRDWVDEIIIVDTGSSDKTVQIAKSYGARVHHHAWEGNFSRARNYSLGYATKEWILVIDADERVEAEDVAMVLSTLLDASQSVVSVNVFNTYEQNKNLTVFLPSVRFFKRELHLQYGGIVHNQLILPDGARVLRTGIRVIHLGYGLSADKMARKQARSRELLEKQLSEHPDNPFALFNYAQLLRSNASGFSSEHIPIIIKAAGRAVELTRPDDPASRHIHLMCLDQLAWANFFDRNFDAAIDYGNKALALKPDYLDPMLLLGHVYTQQEDFPAALCAFQRYLTAREKYIPALEADNIILLHLNSQTIAYYSMAMVCELAHDTNSAKKYYRQTLALDPAYLAANERLARILFAEESYDEAQQLLKRQLELTAPTAELLNDLGNCCFKLGDDSSAEVQYRKALELEPNYPPVWRNLSLTLARMKRYPEAVDLLEAYLAANSEPDLLGVVADIYIALGKPDRAVPVFERFLQAKPSDLGGLFKLSECYLAMGHRDAALVGFKAVLRQNPEFAPAKARIVQIETAQTAPVAASRA